LKFKDKPYFSREKKKKNQKVKKVWSRKKCFWWSLWEI